MALHQKFVRRFKLQLLQHRDPLRPRIFGIGLSKTATTSLCDALTMLDFKSIHYAPIVQVHNNAAKLDWPWWIEDYDAMADLPVAVIYRDLAKQFPTSTFILTTRDEDQWLASASKHFNAQRFELARKEPRYEQGLRLNQLIYGANVFDEELFRASYRKHNDGVREFFSTRSNFYELNICGGGDWSELCAIVNRPIPDVDFPKSNVHHPLGNIGIGR